MILFLSTSFLKAQNEVKIIVNSSNSITSISKAELSNIFLKKISKFKNGVAAIPVDQAPDSPVRKSFSSNYLKKSVSAVKNYWHQQLFSGSNVPPEEKKSDAEVVSFVKDNPGAIAYVSSKATLAGVKTISVQ